MDRRAFIGTLAGGLLAAPLAAGASMKSIQDLLGHSDLRITERYAHLSPSSLKATIGLLEAGSSSTLGHPAGNASLAPEFAPPGQTASMAE